MDLRPVDTEATVNTRNRIRLSSTIALLGVFIYISVQDSFTGAHISFVHLLHLIVQPVILVITILDQSGLPSYASYALFAMLFVDGAIGSLSFISVSRCFNENTATCFERLYEKGTWFILAILFCLADLIGATQLLNLNAQLEEKDLHEKAAIEKQKVSNEPPTWNTVIVTKNKMKVINTFMIAFDIFYIISVLQMIENTPLYWISVWHVVVDPFLLYLDGGNGKAHFIGVRYIYFLLAVCNFISLILQLQNTTETVWTMLSLMISVLYLVVDAVQIIFTTSIISTLEKYDKYKRSI